MADKPNYPYDCPLLLSREDVRDLRKTNVSLAQITVLLEEVKEISSESHRTLRGHNVNDGLIARLKRLEERLNDVTETVDSLKNIPVELDVIKGKVDTLQNIPAHCDGVETLPVTNLAGCQQAEANGDYYSRSRGNHDTDRPPEPPGGGAVQSND